MTVERALRAMAGMVVLVSLILAVVHSQWWLLLTAFVGLNLLQSAFTNACPAKTVFEIMGLRPCEAKVKDRTNEPMQAAKVR